MPRWLWLLTPLVIFVYPCFLNLPGMNWEAGAPKEVRVLENLTALLLIAGTCFAVRQAIRFSRPLLKLWFALLAVGMFYFCGEELSWGQHLLGWQTPAYWGQINELNETNLHNLETPFSSLFEEVPRQVLSIGSVVAGFVLPLIFVLKRTRFPADSLNHSIWPSVYCAPAAVLANIVAQPAKIAHTLGRELPALVDIDYGEVKECQLALFLLLYTVSSSRYLSKMTAAKDSPDDAAPDGSPG